MIADWDEIEQAETSREIHVHCVREINVCLVNGKHRFPLAENLIRQPYPGAKRTRARSQQLTWEPEDSENADDDPTSPPADVDEPAGGDSLPLPDEWRVARDLVIITHHTPRATLFVPTDENCPLQTKIPGCSSDDGNRFRRLVGSPYRELLDCNN